MAWTETRGKRHRGLYRDVNGRIRSVGSFDSKREAKRAAEVAEAEARSDTWLDPDRGKITFSEYFEKHWLPYRDMEKTTRATYLSHYSSDLKDTFGQMPLNQISYSVVQRWITALSVAGGHPKTVEKKFLSLQTILAGTKGGVSAVKDKLITAPWAPGDIRLPKSDKHEVNIYTVEESELLIGRLEPWWRPLRGDPMSGRGARVIKYAGRIEGDYDHATRAVPAWRSESRTGPPTRGPRGCSSPRTPSR